jgi:hypothetical protein
MTTFTAICTILFALLTGWTRAEFVEKMVDVYETKTGQEIVVIDCPFTDTQDYPQACKAREIEITAGTTETTFSPSDKLEPYQAFLFIGKTLMVLQNWNDSQEYQAAFAE